MYFAKQMKQILPKLKHLNKHLNFTKKSFSKGGFRHSVQYINGLITLNKKTVRQISRASLEEKDHCAIDRILREARFDQEHLEKRYLIKIKYLAKGQFIWLMFDDTLVKREGKNIEETKRHKDHSTNSFITGHQFFTSIIHTSLINLPLFPKLYSDNSESKIEMAREIIDIVMNAMPLNGVLFDSWYSEKQIFKKCITHNIKVVCAIKANRKISLERGVWQKLSSFTVEIPDNEFVNHYIDEEKYKIAQYKPKLNGVPRVKLLVSRAYNEKTKTWKSPFLLVSTNKKDSPSTIIRQYNLRWIIEVYHRDIKQNLGFASSFLQKREAIVSHAIFVAIAYAVLQLFMFYRDMKMTIGEIIAYIQDKEMNDFIQEIVEVEDKEERMAMFREVFIREIRFSNIYIIRWFNKFLQELGKNG